MLGVWNLICPHLPFLSCVPSVNPWNSALAITSRASKLHGMTPEQDQATQLAQKLKNQYCRNSHLATLIFDMRSGFANSRFECNHPNQPEALEDARKSIAAHLESGGKPVAILISALGAPFPQLEIFPDFAENSDFCYKLKQYANSL
jgi:hypothetical protein